MKKFLANFKRILAILLAISLINLYYSFNRQKQASNSFFKKNSDDAQTIIELQKSLEIIKKATNRTDSLLTVPFISVTKSISKTYSSKTEKPPATTWTTALHSSEIKQQHEYDYIQRYSKLSSCSIDNYTMWQNETKEMIVNQDNSLYSKPANQTLQNIRIIRGILVFFPIEQLEHFEYEFRWLYRSWTEMLKHEPSKWRTDLIVFIKHKPQLFNKTDFLFNELNCRFNNTRSNKLNKPMCTLIEYESIKLRNVSKNDLNQTTLNKQFTNVNDEIFNYDFLLKDVNLFYNKEEIIDYAEKHKQQNKTTPSISSKRSQQDLDVNLFYYFVKKKLSNYGYVDSILMAFDGYDYFKKAGYDFLIRSDMDVFLTPLFAKWAPKYCNDFYVGGGAYSETTNVKRLRRVSKDLNFKHANIWNLGSTWYSTPEQFRLVSYLTLFGMGYLSEEEFSPVEREGKLGVMMWPYWHYGVLLLYGQNLAMNHLIATKQINIIKLDRLFDVPSGGLIDVNNILHIHVYHGDSMFSKFQFKAGKYDGMMMNLTKGSENTTLIKFYSLKMALEGKFTKLIDLRNLFLNVTISKN